MGVGIKMGTAKKKRVKKKRVIKHELKRYRLCCVCDELFLSQSSDSLTCSNVCFKRGLLYEQARARVEEKYAKGELDPKHENTPSTSVMLEALKPFLN